MSYLVDTSVLVRLANRADAAFAAASRASVELHRLGETLYVAPQNLIEFRSVATRPASANGLGLSTTEAEAHSASFEASFSILPETADIFPAWKAVVGATGAIGKLVHDARLVAICHVHRVSHLLTFDLGHFARLASVGPGVVVVDPVTV